MARRRNKEKMKPVVTFTCTEHGGTADLNEIILEPLVAYINESFGKQIITIRRDSQEDTDN